MMNNVVQHTQDAVGMSCHSQVCTLTLIVLFSNGAWPVRMVQPVRKCMVYLIF